MGVFDRLSNVLKGAVSHRLSELERKNPEAVFQAALDEGSRRLKELDRSLADLAFRRDRTKQELEAKEREIGTMSVEASVETGDDAVAMAILTERDRLQKAIELLQIDLDAAQARLTEGKAAREEMKANLGALKREKDELLAQKASAEATIRTQETLSGLSQDADVRALSNVRENIERLHGAANPGMLDEDGNSVRPALGKVDAKAKEASARAQLQALKRAMGKETAEVVAPEVLGEGDPAPETAAEAEEAEEVTPPSDREIKRTL